MSWHQRSSVLALLMCEGGRRRENASCGGTDAERVVLLLLEREEQEEENSTSGRYALPHPKSVHPMGCATSFIISWRGFWPFFITLLSP